MLSSQEKRGFVVAIIVLGLLAIALVLWLLFFRGASRDGRLTPIPQEERPSQEVVEEETPLPAVITPAAAHVRTVSINFTERFGTYSTDAPYANYEDVRDLVTPVFYVSLQRLPDANQAGYRGVTSRVLSTTVVSGSEDEKRMILEHAVQQEVSDGSRASASVQYRKAQVTLVKEGDNWYVDAFSWE